MKAVHSKEFFEKYEEKLFQKYRKECDYEYSLQLLLPDISNIEVPEAAKAIAIQTLTKINAQKVADEAKEKLMKTMHSIKEISEGRASLGYTTKVQEVSAWHDLNEGFEFSCYMLAKFKEKYSLA